MDARNAELEPGHFVYRHDGSAKPDRIGPGAGASEMRPHGKPVIADPAPAYGRDRRLLFAILVIGVVAVVASWAAIRKAEYLLLEKEALASAVKWANFVRENIPDLDQHLGGLPIHADDRRVYEFASKAGQVFRHKLFGPDGRVVFASDAGDIGKVDVRPSFSALAMKGRSHVRIEDKEDRGGDRTVVSEAYVPIMKEGRFQGAVEVFVDMTPRAIAFRHAGNLAFLGLLVLLGVIGSLCGVFVWHCIRARSHEFDEVVRSRQEVLEAKATVQRSEQELRAIFETVADGIITIDEHGIVRSCNLAAERIFGFSSEDVIGRNVKMLMPDEYAREHDGYLARHRKTDVPSAIGARRDLVGRRKDGTFFPMDLTISKAEIAGGRVFTGIVRDITERKRAEAALRESERHFVNLAANVPGVVYQRVLHDDGTTTYPFVSSGVRDIYGYEPGDITADPSILRCAILPQDMESYETTLAASFGTMSHWRWEGRIATRAGAVKWVRVSARPRRLDNGEIMWDGLILDITDRKQAENRNALLATVLAHVADGIEVTDTEGRIEYVNAALEKMTGYSAREVLGKTPASVYRPEKHDPKLYERIWNSISSGKVWSGSFVSRRKDGSSWYQEATISPVLDAKQTITHYVAIKRDVTEREKAAKELRDRTFRHEIIAAYCENALEVDDIDVLITETVIVLAETLSVKFCEVLEFQPNGESLLLRAGLGWAEGLVGRDLRQAGAGSQAHYTLQSANPVAIEDLRAESRFEVSPVVLEHGPTSGLTMAIPGQTRPYGIISVYALDRRKFTDIEIYFLKAIANVLSAAIARKASEEERDLLADQFHQAQKMEAVGTLAGGIAHDFNNILGIIMGNADVAAMDLPEDNPAHAGLNEILKASQRAKDLVQKILAFSRQDEKELKPIRIDSVVEETLGMMRATLPSTVEIRQRLESASPTVIADATQIQQVIVNICVNAGHAIGGQSGVLRVALEDVEIDGGCAEGLASRLERSPDKIFRTLPSNDGRGWRLWAGLLRSGPHVKLTVSDTGCGMDGATLGRMFEPFFTTKDVGEGTGLGMATVHAIVIGHGGAIVVETAPGEGTVFQIYLPRAEIGVGTDVAGAESAPRGHERILLVDDEEALVQVGARMLGSFGYRVDGMTDGLAALNAFRARPGHWDLVVTDQTMSGLTGTSLARELLHARADIPIILCTGFRKELGDERVGEIGIREILMKPIRGDELARAVRRTLDGD